jgi:PIN domain nuclease of toxin-antitoxin system
MALRLDAPVLTADKAWQDIEVRVPIQLLR